LQGDAHNKIVMTSSANVDNSDDSVNQFSSNIRLVDGPSIIAGRLQLYYKGAWRSVCTSTQ